MIEHSQVIEPSPSKPSGPQPFKASQPGDSSALAAPAPARSNPILVVEDMVELADLYRETLTLHGFEVAVAYNGATALKLLRDQKFQLALVDIDLPDLCGFDVVDRARAAGCLGRTRVVFCTGGYVQERLQRSIQFSESHFIAKPFTIEKLLSTVSDALNGLGR